MLSAYLAAVGLGALAAGLTLLLGSDQGIWPRARPLAGPILSVLIFGLAGTTLWLAGFGEPANAVASALCGSVFGVMLVRWLRTGLDAEPPPPA